MRLRDLDVGSLARHNDVTVRIINHTTTRAWFKVLGNDTAEWTEAEPSDNWEPVDEPEQSTERRGPKIPPGRAIVLHRHPWSYAYDTPAGPRLRCTACGISYIEGAEPEPTATPCEPRQPEAARAGSPAGTRRRERDGDPRRPAAPGRRELPGARPIPERTRREHMLTMLDLLRLGRERVRTGWTQHAPARKRNGCPCAGNDAEAVEWDACGAVFDVDENENGGEDAAYNLYLETKSELFRSVPCMTPGSHFGRLSLWNDCFGRTQAEVVRLYDMTIERVRTREALLDGLPAGAPPSLAALACYLLRCRPRTRPAITCLIHAQGRLLAKTTDGTDTDTCALIGTVQDAVRRVTEWLDRTGAAHLRDPLKNQLTHACAMRTSLPARVRTEFTMRPRG